MSQLRPLYQIRAEHLNILQLIEESDGELTPEVESALAITEEEFQSKAVSYGYVIKGFEDTSSVIDAEIERLTNLKYRASRKLELFKQTLSQAMQEFGVEKVETPTLKLSFRKSEAIEITDEGAIPVEYIDEKVTTSISKTRIKEALKEGRAVAGAQLVQRKSLQIK